MQFLVLVLFLPATYFGFLSYKWLYRKIQKKDRVHRTKKALPILLLLLLAPIIPDYIAFGALNATEKQSYWLYASILFLFLDLIVFVCLLVIKATNTRKNITKLLINLIYIVVLISAIWWSCSAFTIGIYDGKFGISRNQAIDAVEKYLGANVNHSFTKSQKEDENWLITESVNTRDSSAKTEMVYYVNRSNGSVSRNPALSKVHLNISKTNGQPVQDAEIIVLEDQSLGKSEQGLWKNSEYDVSDSNGGVDVWIANDSQRRYHMQVRDCTTFCTNHFFKFSYPLNDSYNIVLDPLNQSIIEIK